jgi:hypothetical protein
MHDDTAYFRWLRTLDNGCAMHCRAEDFDELYAYRVPSETDGQRQRYRPYEQDVAEQAEPTQDWAALLRERPCSAELVAELAERLGVETAALTRLHVGYIWETQRFPRRWLFPERDAAGMIIGVSTRDPKGDKRQLTGSHRGLIYDPAMPLEGTILIPEGASDVATALSMGLAAVGRPSNCGGAEHLADLLKTALLDGAKVVLLGENDRKEDGRWPGKEGAEAVAKRLRVAWGAAVPILYPPDGAKDLRSWVRDHRPEAEDWPALGRLFLERLGPIPELESVSEFEQPFSLGPIALEVLRSGKGNRPCPLHFTPHLELKANPVIQATLGVRCRNYSCPSCGPRRRCCWMLHLARLWEALGRDLWCAEIGQGNPLRAIIRRLQRDRRNFVAVKQSSGTVNVVYGDQTGDVGVCIWANTNTDSKSTSSNLPIIQTATNLTSVHSSSRNLPIIQTRTSSTNVHRRVSPAEALESVAQALGNLASTRRPITTSLAWKLIDPTRSSGSWARKGSAPEGTIEVVEDQLRADGLLRDSVEQEYGHKLTWVMPSDWTEEQRDAYRDNLGFGFEIGL